MGDIVPGKVSRQRNFEFLISFSSILLWLFTIYYIINRNISLSIFTIIFIGSLITIYIISNINNNINNLDRYYVFAYSLSAILTLLATMWTVFHFQRLLSTHGNHPIADYIVAAVFISVLLFLVYDEFGTVFLIVILSVIAYGLIGFVFPTSSIFYHRGLSFERILEVSMLNMTGIYGSLAEIVPMVIAPFLLFAAIIQALGAMTLLQILAKNITQNLRSGVAQFCVILSMVFGSVNGSVLGNISVTGPYTIELMKDSGVRPSRAAAIETVASSGGQILPPIMGAAAFIMADLLQISLVTVLAAAAVPALIYYILLVFILTIVVPSEIHNEANPDQGDNKNNINIDDNYGERINMKIDSKMNFTLTTLQFLIPLIILLYTLLILRMPAPLAAAYTVLATIAFQILWVLVLNIKNSGLMGSISDSMKIIVEGSVIAIKTTAPIAIIVSAIGMLVAILSTTGFPAALSFALVDISGGNLAALLLITMVASILLGMGMPTTATYLVVAILIAPSIIEFGVSALSAHFFVFYFGILADITPPIAVAIVVACSVAGSEFWPTCKEAIKISSPMFLLPFAFIFHPVLLSPYISAEFVISFFITLTGTLIMAYGMNHQKRFIQFNTEHKYALIIQKITISLFGISIIIYPMYRELYLLFRIIL